jgi:hypothetical protein
VKLAVRIVEDSLSSSKIGLTTNPHFRNLVLPPRSPENGVSIGSHAIAAIPNLRSFFRPIPDVPLNWQTSSPASQQRDCRYKNLERPHSAIDKTDDLIKIFLIDHIYNRISKSVWIYPAENPIMQLRSRQRLYPPDSPRRKTMKKHIETVRDLFGIALVAIVAVAVSSGPTLYTALHNAA